MVVQQYEVVIGQQKQLEAAYERLHNQAPICSQELNLAELHIIFRMSDVLTMRLVVRIGISSKSSQEFLQEVESLRNKVCQSSAANDWGTLCELADATGGAKLLRVDMD